MEYYIIENGMQVGPFPKEQLIYHGLNPNSMVWAQGMPQWVPAYTVPELRELLRPGSVPPPFGGQPASGDSLSDTGISGKSRLAFALFAILLGALGIQYFYVNKIGGGIATIALSTVTCGLWPIVMLIQGILVLTMSQQTFEQKYVYSQSFLPLF